MDTAFSNYDDEYDIHVMGSHNTYLTVSSRLGLLYPVLLVLIYRLVFKEFYYWFGYHNYKRDLLIFVSFFTVTIIGLFNLLLESPIYASLYWMLLGFVARAIEARKEEMYGRGQPGHPQEHPQPATT
jgi:O-antigen ligase